ncbi:hypothetical protein E5676_scaffold409G00850 [Cucumis melo var. makuwa]|uniref:Uncharacterized protein n=1 Tax=Cucumis melo var. makuwa TaxID=1194695 RepID=A0A5D3BZ83_CUCMM|nr:hypothetical protein E5676_scaffold409G00850 [Cucumis melo var. makuwa]
MSSVIQLLLGDDKAFAVRSTVLIHRPGRSGQTPLSFGEVVLPSAIQLLSEDDRAFAVRSTALVGAIGHLHRLERWYCRQRSNFYRGTIGLLPSDPPLWGRSGFYRQIHRSGRSDRTPSLFREERSDTFIVWRDGGKIVPSTSSWRSKGGAVPSSSSQGYNILEMRRSKADVEGRSFFDVEILSLLKAKVRVEGRGTMILSVLSSRFAPSPRQLGKRACDLIKLKLKG